MTKKMALGISVGLTTFVIAAIWLMVIDSSTAAPIGEPVFEPAAVPAVVPAVAPAVESVATPAAEPVIEVVIEPLDQAVAGAEATAQDSSPAAVDAPSNQVENAATKIKQLEELNTVLLQRELIFQSQIEEANNRLQALSDSVQGAVLISEPGNPDGGMISQDQAISIAMAYAGGGRVREAELEEEHGFMVYEVEIRTGRGELEVYVDAYTGEVVYSEGSGDDGSSDDGSSDDGSSDDD